LAELSQRPLREAGQPPGVSSSERVQNSLEGNKAQVCLLLLRRYTAFSVYLLLANHEAPRVIKKNLDNFLKCHKIHKQIYHRNHL
jgi:hypothetical protein